MREAMGGTTYARGRGDSAPRCPWIRAPPREPEARPDCRCPA